MEMIQLLLLAVGHSQLTQKVHQPPSQLQVTVTRVMFKVVFSALIPIYKQGKTLFISVQHVLLEN